MMNRGDVICIHIGPGYKQDKIPRGNSTPRQNWDMETDFAQDLDPRNSKDRAELKALGYSHQLVKRTDIDPMGQNRLSFFKVFARLDENEPIKHDMNKLRAENIGKIIESAQLSTIKPHKKNSLEKGVGVDRSVIYRSDLFKKIKNRHQEEEELLNKQYKNVKICSSLPAEPSKTR